MTLDAGGLAWRTAFLVNVPVGAVLLVVGRRVLAAVATPPVRSSALDLPGCCCWPPRCSPWSRRRCSPGTSVGLAGRCRPEWVWAWWGSGCSSVTRPD
ncbi:hypothetical protein NKG94_46205 [Micromonospora sp. M12]